MNERVSSTEAAQFLDVSESRIRQLCLSGRIKGQKVPPDKYRGVWFIEKDSLLRYKQQRRKK